MSSRLLKGTLIGIEHTDQVWCADITYIPLIGGRTLYLALLMDIFTRMIRGWHLGRSPDERLTQQALVKALSTGRVPEIHHSDQGSQYTAHGYLALVEEVGAEVSMSGRAKAWENPFVESAIGHLKEEEVWQNEYESFEEVYARLSYFLDVFYNHERIHSSLGYLTPAEFEAKSQK